MIAIQTRFIGPTNTKGARIVAETCEPRPRRRYMSCHADLGIEGNHIAAARSLIVKLGWEPKAPNTYDDWYQGGTAKGYVFVCALDYAKIHFKVTA